MQAWAVCAGRRPAYGACPCLPGVDTPALTVSRWLARPAAVTDALEGGAHQRVAAAALLVSVWGAPPTA